MKILIVDDEKIILEKLKNVYFTDFYRKREYFYF